MQYIWMKWEVTAHAHASELSPLLCMNTFCGPPRKVVACPICCSTCCNERSSHRDFRAGSGGLLVNLRRKLLGASAFEALESQFEARLG